MHFSGVWCPANSEPIARAKSEMAEFLFNQTSFQLDLNKSVLPELKIGVPQLQEPLAAACLDHPDQAQSNPDRSLKFQYKMYDDDSQTAVTDSTPNGVYRMATSSLEAGYILYG